MLKKIILCTLFIFVVTSMVFSQDYQYLEYQNEQILQTEKYQRGNGYQKDFLLFMELLQTTHPAFAPDQQHPFDVNLITEKGYQHLELCNSLFDFKLFLSSLIAPLHDGHTFVGLFQENGIDILYPLQIQLQDEVPYIMALEKEYETALEKQIISINGFSITDIYKKFGEILVADNDFFLKQQVFEMILLPEIWNFIDKNVDNTKLHFTFFDETSIDIQAKRMEDIGEVAFVGSENQNSEITTYNRKLPFFYTILEKERLAYLQFNECVDQNSVRHYYDNSGHENINGKFSPELEDIFQQYPRFDTLLLSLFSEIKSKNISTLVVDVRNNSGGNSALCSQLLSYLVPNIEDIKSLNEAIRISDYLIHYYSEWYENLCKNIHFQPEMGRLYSESELLVEDSLEQVDIMKKYFTMNDDISLVFNGKTIFLQGKKTYSSAGILLVEARDNEIGKIIGEKSTYKPCSFGDILSWKLPNTQITGGISHKYFTRPDESKCNEEYLSPDVYIPTTLEDYKNGIDPCWEWIKKNY